MVSKIEPDRYADTGYSVADTPAEVNEQLFRRMMEKSGECRLRIGCGMTDTARELVWAGISSSLPQAERRRQFLKKFYGSSFPVETVV